MNTVEMTSNEEKDTVSSWMSRTPHTLEESAHVDEAEALLRAHRIRHLPITREGRLTGILTERDMLVAAQFAQTRHLAVGVIMATDPIVVRPDARLMDVAEQLCTTGEDVVIVVEEDRIVGVFTAVDAVRALAGRPRSA